MRNSIVVFIMTIMLASCSNLRGTFDESSTYYNNMIRWNELGKASLLLSESRREASLDRLKAASNVRIVDTRIIGITYNEEKRKATVEVDIDYHFTFTARVKTLRYTQEWAYTEEGGVAGWRVISLLPEFK